MGARVRRNAPLGLLEPPTHDVVTPGQDGVVLKRNVFPMMDARGSLFPGVNLH